MDIIKSIEHEQLKSKVPDIRVGNTVRVHQRIKEGNRQRIQVFEGIVIKKQNGGLNETFTVRRVAYGVGVEKTFLLNSPLVEKVETIRIGKARRAKLYYLRDRIGKAAKTKENLGARIENKEIIVKEEMPAEEIEEVVAKEAELINEVESAATAEKIEEKIEESKVVEEKAEEKETVEEKKEEVKEETTTEEKADKEAKTE